MFGRFAYYYINWMVEICPADVPISKGTPLQDLWVRTRNHIKISFQLRYVDHPPIDYPTLLIHIDGRTLIG